jgi:tetratricopeptide (TPR) repeat protein
LIARLDHLGPEARETAQAGSVIGREFSYSLLTRMLQTSGISHSGKIEAALKALAGSGLIFKRGASPNGAYSFKHALVQDAAYSTLLRAQRQKLHAALASIMARDETVAPEVLAYHFAGAGELEKAAEYWFIAGQAANERSATSEAIRSLQNALQIISSLPETRERKLKALEIIGALCSPLIAINWLMPETTEMILRAGALADELRVQPAPVIVYHQWLLAFGSSNHQQVLSLAERFREVGGAELRTRACTITSNALYISGASLEEALDYSAKALAAYDRKLHSKQRFQYSYEPRANALANQSLQLALRGYFDQAKAAEQEGIEYAAEFNHEQTTGVLLAYKLIRIELQRDYAQREPTVNALLRHAAEHKIVFWSLWADIFRGFAKACGGETAEGIQMMDKTLKVFAEMKLTYFRSVPLGMKARAYHACGDFGNGLAAVDEAIAFAKGSGERVVFSDLIRLSGDLHLAQSGAPAAGMAESLFVEAIAVAQAQASKLHEIRAATSLARLWKGQGKYAEARDVLYPVYSWFREGLGSADLVEAKAVLDGVSARLRHASA